MDDQDAIDRDTGMCLQQKGGWGCTQVVNHTGSHRARGDAQGTVYAEWVDGGPVHENRWPYDGADADPGDCNDALGG